MVHRVRVADTTAKIQAIKLVREITGFGLKDSLDLVEAKAFFEVDRDEATLLRIADEGTRAGVQFEFIPPLSASSSVAGESAGGSEQAGDFAVRYRSGPNKIHAIKLVRELHPELGLANAKDVVEQQGLIRVGLAAREAERIVGLFSEISSVVEVERISGGSTPSLPAPRAGTAQAVYGYASEDDDF